MNKKYELTGNTIVIGSHTLFQIRALRDFWDITKGDLGGYIESEYNLSHEGDCWVYDRGCVYGEGRVYEHGRVFDQGQVCDYGSVFGKGCIWGHDRVYGHGSVYGDGRAYGDDRVCGTACINAYRTVYGYDEEF